MGKSVLLLLIIAILAVVPFAYSEISIEADQSSYNLGSKISVSASVLQNAKFEGFFKLSLACESYNLDFFLMPVSLEERFRTDVNSPSINAKEQMKGQCRITGKLFNDENTLEEKSSEHFEVTDELLILPVNIKITELPGKSIEITGVLNQKFGDNVEKGSVEIILDEISYSTEASNGRFLQTINIPSGIKSGIHNISIMASDIYKNHGQSSVSLDVTPIPTLIQTNLTGTEYLPGSSVPITSKVYDQAGDILPVPILLEFYSPLSLNVFKKTVQSSEPIVYELSQYAEPGDYRLVSTYGPLKTENTLKVVEVRKVSIAYKNGSVHVENTGNIPFEDKFDFFVQGQNEKLSISKNLKIEPAKTAIVDLTRELAAGFYKITIPVKEGFSFPVMQAPVSNGTNFTSGLIDEVNGFILSEGSEITDNRPAYKKLSSSVSGITGAVVGADGYMTSHPILSIGVLAILLLSIIAYFGRKPIMKIMGKKEDDTELKKFQKY